MKKFVVLFSLTMASLGLAQEKTIKFQADIKNMTEKEIKIFDAEGIPKIINGDGKGYFEEAFKVKDGFYSMLVGDKPISLYLKGGEDLALKVDDTNFYQTLTFTGKGAAENNFLAEIQRQYKDLEPIVRSEDKVFKEAMVKLYGKDLAINEKSNFDPSFIELMKNRLKEEEKNIKEWHKSSLKKQKFSNTMAVPFDYENHAGGKTKLEDFKGKYIYIDVWATWCMPCIQELPALKKVEERYRNKNIAFVGISIDDIKDFKNWKAFVTDNQMVGFQLFANKNPNEIFIKTYQINEIPRFMLIDPTGKIIDSDAYSPSSPYLIEELDKYL